MNRLLRLMTNLPEDVDAALITSPINRRYYTGFQSSAGAVAVTRRQCYFIVDSRYYEAASQAATNCQVVLQEKLTDQLGEIWEHHGVKRLAVESKAMTLGEYNRFRESFGRLELVTDNRLSDAIAEQRAVKSEEEIACIEAAQDISEEVFVHILDFIRPGKTEREIAVEMELMSRRLGSDRPAFSTIVASGKNSSRPHAVPTDKPVEAGDFITMDYGATMGGYCSDMTRTVALGSVSDKQRDVYETVLAAQSAALDAIHAGVPCGEVDREARQLIDATPYQGAFGHGLGHCLGMEVHESPSCGPNSPDTLLAGMVTSVEPGIYLPGEFGVRIEDIVVVTPGGYRNLTACPKELICLPV